MVGLREPLAFCGVLARCGRSGVGRWGGMGWGRGQEVVPLHSSFPDCGVLFLMGLLPVVGQNDVGQPTR